MLKNTNYGFITFRFWKSFISLLFLCFYICVWSVLCESFFKLDPSNHVLIDRLNQFSTFWHNIISWLFPGWRVWFGFVLGLTDVGPELPAGPEWKQSRAQLSAMWLVGFSPVWPSHLSLKPLFRPQQIIRKILSHLLPVVILLASNLRNEIYSVSIYESYQSNINIPP